MALISDIFGFSESDSNKYRAQEDVYGRKGEFIRPAYEKVRPRVGLRRLVIFIITDKVKRLCMEVTLYYLSGAMMTLMNRMIPSGGFTQSQFRLTTAIIKKQVVRFRHDMSTMPPVFIFGRDMRDVTTAWQDLKLPQINPTLVETRKANATTRGQAISSFVSSWDVKSKPAVWIVSSPEHWLELTHALAIKLGSTAIYAYKQDRSTSIFNVKAIASRGKTVSKTKLKLIIPKVSITTMLWVPGCLLIARVPDGLTVAALAENDVEPIRMLRDALLCRVAVASSQLAINKTNIPAAMAPSKGMGYDLDSQEQDMSLRFDLEDS